MHTQWSDGSGTIQDMANAALERGYQYIGITDHTKRAQNAGGLDEQGLEKQGKEIAALNRSLKRQGFTILKSAEMNLSPTGEGDMKPYALKCWMLFWAAFTRLCERLTIKQTDAWIA